MRTCTVRFEPDAKTVSVPVGALVHEAALLAGLDVNMPCGGQGRCGRCAVIVDAGASAPAFHAAPVWADLAQGYALACQTVVEGDVRCGCCRRRRSSAG